MTDSSASYTSSELQDSSELKDSSVVEHRPISLPDRTHRALLALYLCRFLTFAFTFALIVVAAASKPLVCQAGFGLRLCILPELVAVTSVRVPAKLPTIYLSANGGVGDAYMALDMDGRFVCLLPRVRG